MKNYGLPYQGSKNKILPWLFENLPKKKTLYDLFGGGGSVSDYALTENKYEKIIYNEINPLVEETFKKAINGDYKNETRWISREDFDRLKNTDGYVALCWSFGNNQTRYLYSREYMYWKKALHFAVIFNDFSMFKEMGIEVSTKETDLHKRKLDLGRQLKAKKEENKRKYISWFLHNIKGYEIDDVEKLFIDLRCKKQTTEDELRKYLCDALKASGLKQSDVNKKLGTQMAGHYFGRSQWTFPTKEEYEKMQQFMPALKEDYYKITQLKTLQDTLQSLQSLQNLESLQSLQNLESLQRLERLQSLEKVATQSKIEFYNRSYDEIKIEDEDAVIYCDIPYKNCADYNREFDYEKFYNWCEKQTVPVYISEYYMPEDRFEIIAENKITRKFSRTAANECHEKLYRPKTQLMKEKMGKHNGK